MKTRIERKHIPTAGANEREPTTVEAKSLESGDYFCFTSMRGVHLRLGYQPHRRPTFNITKSYDSDLDDGERPVVLLKLVSADPDGTLVFVLAAEAEE